MSGESHYAIVFESDRKDYDSRADVIGPFDDLAALNAFMASLTDAEYLEPHGPYGGYRHWLTTRPDDICTPEQWRTNDAPEEEDEE